MSTNFPPFRSSDVPANARIGIVAARFNSEIVAELLRGCLARLAHHGVESSRVEVAHVPGAFELPVGAKWMINLKQVQAVICLGCVIRGETPHFDFVAGEAARGIQMISLNSTIPAIFGVLTTNTEAQAWARAGRGSGNGESNEAAHGHAGERAADAALEMVALNARLKS